MNYTDLMNAILRAEGKSDLGAIECLKGALCDHFKDAGAPQIAERLEALLSRVADAVESF